MAATSVSQMSQTNWFPLTLLNGSELKIPIHPGISPNEAACAVSAVNKKLAFSILPEGNKVKMIEIPKTTGSTKATKFSEIPCNNGSSCLHSWCKFVHPADWVRPEGPSTRPGKKCIHGLKCKYWNFSTNTGSCAYSHSSE
jgi:hypothetical protein